MSITQDQMSCCGHDWDTWDQHGKCAHVDTCQNCWVEMPDWLEFVEDQKINLEVELKAVQVRRDNYADDYLEMKAKLDMILARIDVEVGINGRMEVSTPMNQPTDPKASMKALDELIGEQ